MPLAAYGYVPTLKRVFDRLGYTLAERFKEVGLSVKTGFAFDSLDTIQLKS